MTMKRDKELMGKLLLKLESYAVGVRSGGSPAQWA